MENNKTNDILQELLYHLVTKDKDFDDFTDSDWIVFRSHFNSACDSHPLGATGVWKDNLPKREQQEEKA